MKVIHLLNKIATGDRLPNKIKYYGYIFEYDTNHLRYETYFDKQIWRLEDFVNVNDNLNDEIEIIEDTPKEDKKIAKIGKLNQVSDNKQHLNNYILRNKINEIIDRLNGDLDDN